jgi:hypothetical protein
MSYKLVLNLDSPQLHKLPLGFSNPSYHLCPLTCDHPTHTQHLLQPPGTHSVQLSPIPRHYHSNTSPSTTLQPNFLLPPFLTSPSLLLISFPFKSLFFFPPFNNSRCPALAPSVRSVIAVKPAECFCFPSAPRPLQFPSFISLSFPSLSKTTSHTPFSGILPPPHPSSATNTNSRKQNQPTASAPLADMIGWGKEKE